MILGNGLGIDRCEGEMDFSKRAPATIAVGPAKRKRKKSQPADLDVEDMPFEPPLPAASSDCAMRGAPAQLMEAGAPDGIYVAKRRPADVNRRPATAPKRFPAVAIEKVRRENVTAANFPVGVLDVVTVGCGRCRMAKYGCEGCRRRKGLALVNEDDDVWAWS